MNNPTDRVEGRRLILRPLTLDDIEPAYAAWMRDPDVTRYLESRFTEHTPETLRAYVQQVNADPDTHLFAMVLKDGDRHIGNIKLGPIERHHGRGDIGLIIGERDCWGQGYAAEAIESLCTFAFGTLGLHKVTAGAYEANRGSVQAFLKAGFRVEGQRREHYMSDGVWMDAVLLGRIAPS